MSVTNAVAGRHYENQFRAETFVPRERLLVETSQR